MSFIFYLYGGLRDRTLKEKVMPVPKMLQTIGMSNYKVGWLIGFNGISTSIGYLMPKPVYTYVRSNYKTLVQTCRGVRPSPQ